MSKAKCNLICDSCGRRGRNIIMHKGKFLCRLCIRRLPSTRMQEGVIMIYDYLFGRRKGKLGVKRANSKKA